MFISSEHNTANGDAISFANANLVTNQNIGQTAVFDEVEDGARGVKPCWWCYMKCQGITKVIRSHPLVTMNICAKCQNVNPVVEEMSGDHDCLRYISLQFIQNLLRYFCQDQLFFIVLTEIQCMLGSMLICLLYNRVKGITIGTFSQKLCFVT